VNALAALGFVAAFSALCPPANLCPPPADAYEQKSPVGKKFRRLAFEGVADELKDPSHDEKRQRIVPEPMLEDAGYKNRDRDEDQWNAKGVAKAIHRMLMAGGVLRDPLLAAAVA
jgi:hypothetical protein